MVSVVVVVLNGKAFLVAMLRILKLLTERSAFDLFIPTW